MAHHSSLPPPHAIVPGTRLGRYEIIAELGTGGMATVYLGRALSVAGFQRLVAIKYLHPHLLKDETFVQMFLDEGRLAARIHHPNVVGTLDLVHESEGLYIVSEYIEGDQLLSLFRAARDQNGRIPVGITVRIMLDILAGLHAAHDLVDDLGTPLKPVHRDVSPQNILVGADGISRITDFGIAKAEERISNTRDGIVKGKLSYMAPEQPNDLPIDRRTDVFSAATVLWECLTGRRLFPGKTDGEVLQNLLNKPILHLREVDGEFSTAIDDVLAKALSRNIEDRFDTAADFADALEVAAIPLGIATPREVSRHVKEIASEKLTEVKQRRRAMTTRDLPVFRASVAPAGESDVAAAPTPSGVHSIGAAAAAAASAKPSAATSVDEAPTRVQSPSFVPEPEPLRSPLPPLPRAAPALPPPSLRKASRPDAAPPPLPARTSQPELPKAEVAPPAPAAPAEEQPDVPARQATPPDPESLDSEAPTLASISFSLPPSQPSMVPSPLAFAPPPRDAGYDLRSLATSAPPSRRSNASLVAVVVVGIGVALGLAIYRFTTAEPTPPSASQAELQPAPSPAAAPSRPPPAANVEPPPMAAPEPEPAPAPSPPVEAAAPPVARPAVQVARPAVRPVVPVARPAAPVVPVARPVVPVARPVAPVARPVAPVAPPPSPPSRESDLPTSI